MPDLSRRRAAVVLVAACLLAHGLPVAQAHTGYDFALGDIAVADITVRDELIADQEALLNAYRCRFGVDTEAVPGGCSNGVPKAKMTPPGEFHGEATLVAMKIRDRLIAEQERLLDEYRCGFGVDTEIVDGGCAVSQLLQGKNAVTLGWYPDPTCRYEERWWGRYQELWYEERWGWQERVRTQGLEVDDPHSILYNSNSNLPLPGEEFTCGGASESGQLTLGQRIASIKIGDWQMCLLRVDGVVACTEPIHPIVTIGPVVRSTGRSASPLVGQYLSGRFLSISVGGLHSCGVLVDETVTCWSMPNSWDGDEAFPAAHNLYGRLDSPSGRFESVSASMNFSCGVRIDKTIACWGINQMGQTNAPAGQFMSVSSGFDHSCGILLDNTIECWGDNQYGQLEAPVGHFESISAGNKFSCGIRVSREIACWGTDVEFNQNTDSGNSTTPIVTPKYNFSSPQFGFGRLNPPVGKYSEVSVGLTHACGLRLDLAIVCWGHGKEWSLRVSGLQQQFTAISSARHVTCAVRTNGTALCRNTFPERRREGFGWDWNYPYLRDFQVRVFYCVAKNMGYDSFKLTQEVERLNNSLNEFFSEESSGSVDVEILYGGIIFLDVLDESSCYQRVTESLGVPSLLLILLDDMGLNFDNQAGGTPQSGLFLNANNASTFSNYYLSEFDRTAVDHGVAWVNTLLKHYRYYGCESSSDHDLQCIINAQSRYSYTVAHELGHSIFGFSHPPDCSIMGTGYYRCPDTGLPELAYSEGVSIRDHPDYSVFLDQNYIGCRDRRIVGWPEDKCEEPVREPDSYVFSLFFP